jgi:putative addiction module component (TIGR02574 family)
MSSRLLNSALKLSKSQRILLVEQIWDSLSDQQLEPDLTGEQKAELDRRLARLDKTGPLGSIAIFNAKRDPADWQKRL